MQKVVSLGAAFVVGALTLADTGTVSFAGRDVTRLNDNQRAQYIGRVFQNPSLGTAPHMSIEENLSIAWERGKTRTLGLGVNKAKREMYREQLTTLHQRRIILDLPQEQKSQMTVPDLLAEFDNVRGAELTDRDLLV